ncbi:hypothetical protein SAMN05216258_102237 [Albimonas pacifica]|uniref:Uncharacterized protein n=1 Tax=Albimonas pacifica TaxID=1114924 RepID=A0A1I3CW22_9RHOB|nr:hypothetical protein [Albimonas pacifica]SFH78538.1 hypothetical protein SAMN05216258_102237 [Albimonas pacifica]
MHLARNSHEGRRGPLLPIPNRARIAADPADLAELLRRFPRLGQRDDRSAAETDIPRSTLDH